MRRRFWRLLAVSAAEKPLQQPRPARFGGCLHLTQRLALQAAELTQQQRQFPGLTDTAIQLFGKFLKGLSDFPWQRQCLQLSHQRVQCSADLINPGFATLLGIEHGFFQARQQGGEAGVHVVGAHHVAHFFHALINDAVGALSGQRAAHQASAQQVEPCGPATFEFVLLFDAFEVFLFPALGFVAHSGVPRGAGLNAGNASAVSEPGRRISTATGR